MLAGAPPAAHAQDREQGPPVVLAGPFALPGAVAAVRPPTAAGTGELQLAVAETGARRLALAPLTPGDLGSEPTWTAVGETPSATDPAALLSPQGIAASPDGAHLYVADAAAGRVLRFAWEAGAGTWGAPAELAPGGPPATDPRPLSFPRDVAVGADGRIHLLDSGNDRVLVAAGPDAASWAVEHSDPSWDRATGLDVAPDGTLYVADTGNHRILRLPAGGAPAEVVADRWGAEGAGLREPRDVALGPDGRLYVADAWNHRVAVLEADGSLHRSLGSAPLLGRPERLAFDAEGRLFVADPQNGWVVAWPGPASLAAGVDDEPRFVATLRDGPADDGSEPSAPAGSTVAESSPDLLVRWLPDLDLAAAEEHGLALVGEDVPVVGRDLHLYFEVHNRGDEPFAGGALGLWEHRGPGSTLAFPEGWRRDRFFRAPAGDAGVPEPDAFLAVDFVAPGGNAIVGPLLWRPAASGAASPSCSDTTRLLAALVDLEEPLPAASSALEAARLASDVVVRRLPLVPASCVPEADRYEENDRWATGAWPEEEWEHLHARCPRTVTRALGESYPDFECPGVFEDGVAPKGAEEIWRLTIPDLSLHSTTDRDFFFVPLPRFHNPRWGLDDIRPERDRIRSPDAREPMPECGAVQRVDPGPAGRDNRVWINVTTDLLVIAEGVPGPGGAPAPALAGEEIRLYRDGEAAPELGGPERLVLRIVCPGDSEEIEDLELSFGERGTDVFLPRGLGELGHYRLRFEVVASIDRGIPDWASGANDERGVRRIPCLAAPRPGGPFGPLPGLGGGLLPRGVFPLCGGTGPAGDLRIVVPHPQTPDLSCIADGPGCMELSIFDWPTGREDLDLVLRSPLALELRLLDPSGQEIARAEPFSGEQGPLPLADGQMEAFWPASRLRVEGLAAGTYFFAVEGPPTSYALEYAPPQALSGKGGGEPKEPGDDGKQPPEGKGDGGGKSGGGKGEEGKGVQLGTAGVAGCLTL